MSETQATTAAHRKSFPGTSLLLPLLVVILLGYLYGFRGNSQEIDVFGTSAIGWTVKRWLWAGSDFSHAWLIPLISAGIVWWKRKELAAAPKSVNYFGLALVILCLAIHWLGVRVQLTRISLISLIGLLWAIPLYIYGGKVAAILLFPCAYLALCIPMSFLNAFTVPLRLFASTAAAGILNGLGIATARTGTMIVSVEPGLFRFGVADPCSGLRSLIAMTALAAVYSYMTQKTLVKKWTLFLLAVPIAIIGNITRIVMLALIAMTFGQQYASDIYEKFSGMIIFTIAVLLMIGFDRLINVDYRTKLEQWKDEHLRTTQS